MLPSPALTAPSSAKPSAIKSNVVKEPVSGKSTATKRVRFVDDVISHIQKNGLDTHEVPDFDQKVDASFIYIDGDPSFTDLEDDDVES